MTAAPILLDAGALTPTPPNSMPATTGYFAAPPTIEAPVPDRSPEPAAAAPPPAEYTAATMIPPQAPYDPNSFEPPAPATSAPPAAAAPTPTRLPAEPAEETGEPQADAVTSAPHGEWRQPIEEPAWLRDDAPPSDAAVAGASPSAAPAYDPTAGVAASQETPYEAPQEIAPSDVALHEAAYVSGESAASESLDAAESAMPIWEGSDGAASVAAALESVAARIRAGEIVVPDVEPEYGEAAALAAALAALLGVRH